MTRKRADGSPEDLERAPASASPEHRVPAALAETAEPAGQFPAALAPDDAPAGSAAPDDHEGATEEQVGDRTGPGAGFDATAEDESESTAGQSPGASPNPAKREDPPGPRNPKPREEPPRKPQEPVGSG